VTADQRKKLEEAMFLLQDDVEWTHQGGCNQKVFRLIDEVLSTTNPFSAHWKEESL
jgi:hypothetical protein